MRRLSPRHPLLAVGSMRPRDIESGAPTVWLDVEIGFTGRIHQVERRVGIWAHAYIAAALKQLSFRHFFAFAKDLQWNFLFNHFRINGILEQLELDSVIVYAQREFRPVWKQLAAGDEVITAINIDWHFDFEHHTFLPQ